MKHVLQACPIEGSYESISSRIRSKGQTVSPERPLHCNNPGSNEHHMKGVHSILLSRQTTIEHRQPCRGHHKHQCRGCQHACVVSVVYLTGNKLCLPSIIICLCHVASVLICLEAGIHYCRVALCIGKCSAREINGRQRCYYSS